MPIRIADKSPVQLPNGGKQSVNLAPDTGLMSYTELMGYIRAKADIELKAGAKPSFWLPLGGG